MDSRKTAAIDSVNQCIARLRETQDGLTEPAEREAILVKGSELVRMAVSDGIFSEEDETVYWDLLVLAFDPDASKGY